MQSLKPIFYPVAFIACIVSWLWFLEPDFSEDHLKTYAYQQKCCFEKYERYTSVDSLDLDGFFENYAIEEKYDEDSYELMLLKDGKVIWQICSDNPRPKFKKYSNVLE